MQSQPGHPQEAFHVAVVGGGIAGLAAAWFLRRRHGDRVRVTVFDGASEVGGKLRVSDVAGVAVDEGAEAVLARRPEGVDLARAVGLGEALTSSARTGASLWSRGALRSLPKGQMMGLPGDLAALARSRVLSSAGLARVPLDLGLPRTPLADDASVGRYVEARVGREVVDRLVEPMLGGVYAGRADSLSLEATMPGVAAEVRGGRSLIGAVRTLTAQPGGDGPAFRTLAGGLGRLPRAVADASGAHVRTGTMVRELAATATGWRLTTGPTRAPETVDADAVVLAVPARAAGRLLARESPVAAAELGGVDYASVGIVTLAYESSAFPVPPRESGYLVPAVEGRPVKAVTFTTSKWPYVARQAPHTVIARCSIGRYGQEEELQRGDDELVAAAMAELARTVGVRELPIDSRVTRWGGGFPQYAPGHLGRVARARSAVNGRGGLAVCGAAYGGVGVPACVASARGAADQVLDYLGPDGEWDYDESGQAEGARS